MKKLLLCLILLAGTAFAETNYTMSYTDARTGILFANSYWTIDSCTIKFGESAAVIAFSGYTDSTKAHMIQNKIFVVSGTDFATWFSNAAFKATARTPLAQSWVYVLQAHDTIRQRGPQAAQQGAIFFSGGVFAAQ